MCTTHAPHHIQDPTCAVVAVAIGLGLDTHEVARVMDQIPDVVASITGNAFHPAAFAAALLVAVASFDHAAA